VRRQRAAAYSSGIAAMSMHASVVSSRVNAQKQKTAQVISDRKAHYVHKKTSANKPRDTYTRAVQINHGRRDALNGINQI